MHKQIIIDKLAEEKIGEPSYSIISQRLSLYPDELEEQHIADFDAFLVSLAAEQAEATEFYAKVGAQLDADLIQAASEVEQLAPLMTDQNDAQQ
jgi:hypothetical protein